MVYDFMKREIRYERIVFVLALDKKKLKERIIIGEASEVRRLLERGEGDVFYDRIRPLGTLLIDFETDADRTWNVNAMFLRESYGKISPARGVKFKTIKPAADFLKGKYDSGKPSAIYAAISTWENYVRCYSMNRGPDTFIQRTSLLYRPFFLYGDTKLWQEEAADALARTIHDGESQVELWYPVAKRPFECVVAHASLQPVIFYYLNKIEEWGYVFQKCKVCGNHFLAQSKHYELCGVKCRKAQTREAKRQFDERTKGDRLEQLYDSAYFYWYNRLRRLKRANAAPEHIGEIEAAFGLFRTEAKEKKAMVKSGELPLSDFSGWLVRQQDVIDRLL